MPTDQELRKMQDDLDRIGLLTNIFKPQGENKYYLELNFEIVFCSNNRDDVCERIEILHKNKFMNV